VIIEIDTEAAIAETKRRIALLEAVLQYGNAVAWADRICTDGKFDEKKLDDLIGRRGGTADTPA
jgi:hypothetical protein